GERSQTVGGVRLTLQTFELPATATTAGAAARAGTVFAAADIEACSSSDVGGASPIVASERFRLELPDGTRIPASAAAKSPPLPDWRWSARVGPASPRRSWRPCP